MGFTENLLDAVTTAVASMPLRIFVGDVAENVDYEFIDEIFHYGQFQHYLLGDWAHWDPKITTPPGLYLLTWLYYKLPFVEHDFASARFFNFIGGCFIALCCICIRINSNNPGFNTASILLNPLLSIYYSIYYTDVWSAAIVIFMYAIVIGKPTNNIRLTAILSSTVGLFSLLMRQTNIIWCMFALAALIDQQVKEENGYKYEKYTEDFKAFIKTTFKNISSVVPFGLVGAVFVSFIIENGGITLGDKDNHILVPHMAQMCYCVTFITVFTLPLWISISFLADYLRDNFGSLQMILFNACWVPILSIAVHNFTIIHPFVLADNRHYVFYIVRFFILRDGNARYQLIPVYHFSFYVIYKLFMTSINKVKSTASSLVMFVGWMVCTAVTIIPSPLFEPRYYILPFLMFRLTVHPFNKPLVGFRIFAGENNYKFRYVLEVLWAWLWTQSIYLVFLQFTFQWDDLVEPQRIIW